MASWFLVNITIVGGFDGYWVVLLITLLITFGLYLEGWIFFALKDGMGWDDAATYWSCLYLMPQYDLYKTHLCKSFACLRS